MLKPIRPGLRTIHNGSISVVKAQVNVPPGGDLTVSEVVAEQLLAGFTEFKDGAAPQRLLDALADQAAVEPVEVPAPEPVEDVKPVKRAAKKA